MSGPDQQPQLADEVIQLLVAMNLRLNQHFTANAADLGLSATEGKVLLALDPDQPQPMRAIARKLGFDASNLTGVVDRLEDRGAVRRSPDATDRRIKAIATTTDGAVLRARLAERLRADAAPVHALSNAELGELRVLLRRAMELPS